MRRALLEICPSIRKLKRFVQDHFEHSLTDIADSSSPEDWAEDLLEKAAAEGWIDELYRIFCTTHAKHPQVTQLKRELPDDELLIAESLPGAVSPEQVIGDPNSSNAVVRGEVEGELPTQGEDPGTSHLVIAVFWQERSKQKLRVHPKLYYREPGNHTSSQQSLVEEDCTVVMKMFPEFLEKLLGTAVSELSRVFPEPTTPWKLTIALFLPVDLLASPLAQWCGEKSALLRTYPLVIGCSDRFSLDSTGKSAHLHNQLRAGWSRLQTKVPDGSGKPLKNLAWLSSKQAAKKSFATYSGFKCYGHCLQPGEPHIQHWHELVRSGIPLALWICGAQPQERMMASIFNRLTNCNRFAFLDQIRTIRDEQQKTCNHYVGVFYEDPNYLPDVPRSEQEQFFSWPGA